MEKWKLTQSRSYKKSTINVLFNEMLKKIFSEIKNNIKMDTLTNSI